MKRTAAMVMLLALVTGCQSSSHPAAPAHSSEVPPPLVPAMDLPLAAVDNAIDQLDGIAHELMNSSGIPGMAIAVVHGGKTLYAKGFGVKDVRKGDSLDNRVRADTVFQLASLSKPLAATAIAHQVGVRAIGWDTRLVDVLPWFALADPETTNQVTVGDLLAHRSGLPDHAGGQLEDLGYDRRYVLEHLRDLPLDEFRTSYAYTNFGFTAGAEAVATAARKPWPDLIDQVLYQPLEMSSTSSRYADYRDRTNKAVGHIRAGNGYEPRYQRNADPQAPAGGVSSSVRDLTRWMAMVLANGQYNGRQVVDSAALLPALTPQIVSSRPTEPAMRAGFYGYGFNVNTTSAARTQLSHSGAFDLGAATNLVIIPSADVGIVALTNAAPSGVPETLTAEFADLVQFGEIRQDWRSLYRDAFAAMDQPFGALVGQHPPPGAAAPGPLMSYVGEYANDYWGPARVTERDGGLLLSLGPRAEAWPLRHWDGEVFTFSFVSENSPPGSVSKAVFDGNRLTLEYFDTYGKGTFTR